MPQEAGFHHVPKTDDFQLFRKYQSNFPPLGSERRIKLNLETVEASAATPAKFDRRDIAERSGIYTRCSALAAALALPPDGKVVGLDVCKEYVDVGRPFWKEVLWQGRVYDAGDNSLDTVALRKINEKLGKDTRVDISMLTVGDGITLALKNLLMQTTACISTACISAACISPACIS
ncbi:hypothetical protein IscW_ISCW022685 [Ixodes scapularis]|uniref:Uncharacterized protein n=1 Tax=Ixodes scapularis TaxID=6945 RepID=B7QE61_IXOSC|nr:hypothetical protein IscW_ISCW022685 [Ixodes scapularis]|eukprot:XP_002413825.1 hypothetical protein IscW_ISCW022685 [Ixodes scapularis]